MKQPYSLNTRQGSCLRIGKFKPSKFITILYLLLGILIFDMQYSYAAITTVTNTDDAGAGSLRQAILDANNDAAQDSIEFNIGIGLQTIQPLTPLPNNRQ